MYCLSCGSPVRAGNAFCTICGAAVTGGSPVGFGVPASALRPLSVGERLDASFKAYRANFKANCLAILFIAVPVAIIQAVIAYSTTPTNTTTVSTNAVGQTTVSSITTDQLWTELAGLLLVTILSTILGMWASATCVQIVGGSLVGEEVQWRAALGRSLRRTWSILWITLLLYLMWIIPVAVIGGAGGLMIAFGPRVLGIIVVVIGAIALIPFSLWWYVNQSLAVPVLMLEDIRGIAAIRRSFRLIKKSWWSVFGTLIVMGLLVGFVTYVVTVAFLFARLAASSNVVVSVTLGSLERLIVLVLFTPLTATLLAILTIDMRVRKEGLDLEVLARELVDPAPATAVTSGLAREGSGFPVIDRGSSNPSDDALSPPPDVGG